MKTKAYIGSVIIILVAFLAACQAGSQTPMLDGTSWELVELNGEEPLSNAGKLPVLSFSEGQASGNTGCNYWGSAYTARGDTLSFGEVETTVMLCETPPGLMAQEEVFIQMLNEAERFEIRDNRLTIFTGSGDVFVFGEIGT